MDFENNHDYMSTTNTTSNQSTYKRQSSKYEVVSTGTWFGLITLLGLVNLIPKIGGLIGIIILIVLAVGDSNRNIKNWAIAGLIWLIIAIILGVFLALILISTM